MKSMVTGSLMAGSSPGFAPGAQVELVGPGRARLAGQRHIGLGDVFGLEDLVALQEGVDVLAVGADEDPVDRAVDHHMGDVNTLWAELSRHALGHGAQAVLGGGEGRKAVAPAYAGRRAGEEDRAASPRDHRLGRFAAGEEARET